MSEQSTVEGTGPIEHPHPVTASERHRSLDALRGFALLGILGPNIVSFAWPSMAMTSPAMMGEALVQVTPGAVVNESANELGHDLVSVFFFGKMMFLFSLLFGAGVVMYAKKFEGQKLTEGWWLWYRRMGWLLAIGLLHGVLLWYGDILVWYSVCGLGALWWVRKWSPKWQLLAGGASYLLGTVFMTAMMFLWILSMNRIEGGAEMLHDATEAEVVAYTGTYLDALLSRVIMLAQLWLIVLPFGFFWMCSGIMIAGMGLTRLGVLTGERSVGFYAKAACVCLPVGLGLTAATYFGLQGSGIDNGLMLFQGVGQMVGIPIALGYASVVILLVKLGALRPLTFALEAVGRMALSNYLLQTVIGTVVFYSHGLGMYATVQYPELWMMMVGIWLINIVFSVVWLRVFRFGPAEWAWRSLTYWEPQPMMRAKASTI